MKKYFIIFLILFIACGPSEEEIQTQIDEAVNNALDTQQSNEKTSINKSVPCDLAEISTGGNGLPDLGGCSLSIAIENAYLPFSYIDASDGVAKGWDYDVFNYLSEQMNFTPVYVLQEWSYLIEAVGNNNYMVAGNGITITDERDKIVDFSDPYLVLQQRILVSNNNNEIKSIFDIKNNNLKVSAQKGTYTSEYAISEFGQNNVKIFDTFDATISAVITGEVVASIIDEVGDLGYMGTGRDKVKIVGEGFNQDDLGFIFPNRSPLVNVINQGLSLMKSNGKLQEINLKYFTPDFTVTYDDILNVTYNDQTNTKSQDISNSSSQYETCIAWANSTQINLGKYESIASSISSDSYDAAYGIISFYTYQNNLESYERLLISIENSQKKLSPNSENITSHKHILDAISTSISVVSFTIVGLELDDPSYIELAADLQLLATDSINSATRSFKDC